MAIIAWLIFITFYQQQKANETYQSGKLYKTKVTNIDCTIGKSKSRLYFRNSQGSVKHVNIKYLDCLKFNKGDTISVYENSDEDW